MGKINAVQNYEIKKHVATIHCANTLSLLQRKISNVLLYHAYPNLKFVDEHHITVPEICRYIEYQGNNHAVIKDALKALISTVIEWNLIDKVTNEEEWTASSMLASAKIKGSNCYYAYSPRMKEMLHNPSIYAKINLSIQSKFKSNYGLALYENCIRYKGLSSTKWFDLKLFRVLMGIEKSKYLVFRDFKRRVLDKAIEEVNSYSDILINVEIDRQGHKVLRLRFFIKPKLEQYPQINIINNRVGDMTSLKQFLINDFGFTEKSATSIFAEYSNDYIQEKIQIIKESATYQKKLITKLPAYLMSALKEDFKRTFPVAKKTIPERNEFFSSVKEKKKYEKEIKYKKEYSNYCIKKFDENFCRQNESIKDEIMQQFNETLKNTLLKSIYERYLKFGLEDSRVKHIFMDFVNKKYSNIYPKIMSLEEFIDVIHKPI